MLWGFLMRLCGFSVSTAFAIASVEAQKWAENATIGGNAECEPENQFSAALFQWISAGYFNAGWTRTDPGIPISTPVHSTPLKKNMPTVDNPLFKECSPCLKKPKNRGSFNFNSFWGMGYYDGFNQAQAKP